MFLFDIGLLKIFSLPKVSVNLMLEKTQENDPFFAMVVKKFYAIANAPHPKFPLVKQYQYGFALCRMPEAFEDYFQALKKSARWNFRKANRLGYVVKKFDANSKREDIAAIWRSASARQGKLPKAIREGRVKTVNDPPSRSPFHDYFYVGAFAGDKLLAYASVAVMGEICNLNDLYGHVEYENDGLVPLLLIKIAEMIYTSYPSVKYYGFGTYFGARELMRRFKRKFQFYPYQVQWKLESTPAGEKPYWIYRLNLLRESSCPRLAVGSLIKVTKISEISGAFPIWRENGTLKAALSSALKVAAGKRIFYGLLYDGKMIHSAWLNLGFCRRYSVESDAVVIGRVWTAPEFRGQGLASGAMRRMMNILFRRGYRRFYIDTPPQNIAAQKMIVKAGFSQRID